MRLEPQDEYMHRGDEPNFNESMYFNFFDPGPEVGGWFRVGNRPNEGYAEVTVCLYLPDGTVGFSFGRPEIEGNGSFDAAGLRFEVNEPFKDFSVSYRGKVAHLTEPLAMKEPKEALTSAPKLECRVDLAYLGLSPMWGGEPELEDGDVPFSGMEFARGHYEQHVGGRGTIALGERSFSIDGFGLRDHSWGPRYWQAPLWYRWLTANSGPDSGFMVSIVAGRDGGVRRTGMVFENGGYTPITDAKIETEWETEDRYHNKIRCLATTPDRDLEITGTVRSLIPLRNRRGGELTRISEGLTDWSWEGNAGYGMSEYLDQIVDGSPVGD